VLLLLETLPLPIELLPLVRSELREEEGASARVAVVVAVAVVVVVGIGCS
jgi:hypothetical protein